MDHSAQDRPKYEASHLPHQSAVNHVLQFFAFAHLPERLSVVSEPFHTLAHRVANQSANRETTVALRKLLEAKDAAVRAVVSQLAK